MTFDPQYIDHVPSEKFEDAKALFLSPLLSINYAHLVMLADTAIVSAEEAHALREALDAISVTDVRATPYHDTCEDLFFHIERLIEFGLVGRPAVAGEALLARPDGRGDGRRGVGAECEQQNEGDHERLLGVKPLAASRGPKQQLAKPQAVSAQ